MKTIKRMDSNNIWQYERVSDSIADVKVKNENYEYCHKSEWKTNVRDFKKVKKAKK